MSQTYIAIYQQGKQKIIQRYLVPQGANTLGNHALCQINIKNSSLASQTAIINNNNSKVTIKRLAKGIRMTINKTKASEQFMTIKDNIQYNLDQGILFQIGNLQGYLQTDYINQNTNSRTQIVNHMTNKTQINESKTKIQQSIYEIQMTATLKLPEQIMRQDDLTQRVVEQNQQSQILQFLVSKKAQNKRGIFSLFHNHQVNNQQKLEQQQVNNSINILPSAENRSVPGTSNNSNTNSNPSNQETVMAPTLQNSFEAPMQSLRPTMGRVATIANSQMPVVPQMAQTIIDNSLPNNNAQIQAIIMAKTLQDYEQIIKYQEPNKNIQQNQLQKQSKDLQILVKQKIVFERISIHNKQISQKKNKKANSLDQLLHSIKSQSFENMTFQQNQIAQFIQQNQEVIQIQMKKYKNVETIQKYNQEYQELDQQIMIKQPKRAQLFYDQSIIQSLDDKNKQQEQDDDEQVKFIKRQSLSNLPEIFKMAGQQRIVKPSFSKTLPQQLLKPIIQYKHVAISGFQCTIDMRKKLQKMQMKIIQKSTDPYDLLIINQQNIKICPRLLQSLIMNIEIVGNSIFKVQKDIKYDIYQMNWNDIVSINNRKQLFNNQKIFLSFRTFSRDYHKVVKIAGGQLIQNPDSQNTSIIFYLGRNDYQFYQRFKSNKNKNRFYSDSSFFESIITNTFPVSKPLTKSYFQLDKNKQ